MIPVGGLHERIVGDGPTQVSGLHDFLTLQGLSSGGLGDLGSPGGTSPDVGSMVNLPAVTAPPGQLVQADLPDIQYLKIPGGEAGTAATLKVMKRLVMGPHGARNPRIVLLARKLVQHVQSKDYVAEADAIFNYVKSHVRYRLDPVALEWVQTPIYTLQTHQGDCDDHASLIASLALAAGHRAAFRTVAGDPNRPQSWSHVYAVIGVTRKGETTWLAADTTQNRATLGWEPPEDKIFGKKTWVIDPNIAVEDKQWR